MFSYILGIIQEFERTHGRRPQLICLNASHMHKLMEECPDLFELQPAIPLGFRIMILPESELTHPKAVWLPPRVRPVRARNAEEGPVLLSWTARQQNRT